MRPWLASFGNAISDQRSSCTFRSYLEFNHLRFGSGVGSRLGGGLYCCESYNTAIKFDRFTLRPDTLLAST